MALLESVLSVCCCALLKLWLFYCFSFICVNYLLFVIHAWHLHFPVDKLMNYLTQLEKVNPLREALCWLPWVFRFFCCSHFGWILYLLNYTLFWATNSADKINPVSCSTNWKGKLKQNLWYFLQTLWKNLELCLIMILGWIPLALRKHSVCLRHTFWIFVHKD